MIIRYFNNKSKVINKEHMDPEIVNQRNQFPGNEPMYIVLLLIVILSLIMLLFLWLLSLIARVEVTFRILVIINLLAANFLQTLGFILNFSFEHNRKYYPYFDSTFLCQTQSILLIGFSMSRDLWVVMITIVTFFNVFYNKEFSKKNWMLFVIFCLVSYGIPLSVVLFYVSQGVFGVCELNCWIKKESLDDDGYPGYGTFVYGIKFICMGTVIVLTVLIIKHLFTMNASFDLNKKEVKRYALKMLMFPGVQFLAGFIPTIYTLLLEMMKSTSVSLGFITLFFGSIQGVLFPICYLSNTGSLSVILACMKKDNQPIKQELITKQRDDSYHCDNSDDDTIDQIINIDSQELSLSNIDD